MSEGELIIGNCKLQTCLATGNQTQVWEVTELASSEKYAMKLLLPEAFKDPVQKAALKHEAKVLESLDHPNIVKFKSLVMDKTNGFLLMELFRAPNLKSQAQTDLLSVHTRLKRLIEQVSQAMAHIHDKGWLHKDLKPDNILFSKAAELRVIDFSLSSKMVTGMAALFKGKTKVIQGTRTYMSPEQIRGQKLGPYTDIYNFGVTLFELLTGRSPFAGFTPNDLLKRHISEPAPAPSSFNDNVTPEMDRVILKMLAKKPDARQKTFNELLAEIRNVTLFKEPPEKLIEQRAVDKENEGTEQNLSDRRDSRSDAKRAELAKAEAEAAAVAPPQPVRIPGAPPPSAGQPPPPGMPPRPGPVPPGVVAGRPPQSIPVGGMPPRPGMPPGPPPGPLPPGALPPGARPPQMPPPGAMPLRPAMPVPPGGPRPPGAPLPPGMVPPGMPPRPGTPAVAAGGPPSGGPPRPLPPGMPPAGPRPGPPPGAMPPGPGQPRPPMPGMPPGQPPRPGVPMPGPGGTLPPGVRPPGPPAGGPRPPGPPGPPPRPAPPPAQPAPAPDEASLDDFKIG